MPLGTRCQSICVYGKKIELEEGLIGGASIDACGDPLSDESLERARKSRAVLLGERERRGH